MLWRRKWQPTPVFLPGESHGQRSLAGCNPWALSNSRGQRGSLPQTRRGLTLLSQLCTSWLSSHGRGLGPRDALKKDSRGLCRGAAQSSPITAKEGLWARVRRVTCLTGTLQEPELSRKWHRWTKARSCLDCLTPDPPTPSCTSGPGSCCLHQGRCRRSQGSPPA